jgi:hypothetical protein
MGPREVKAAFPPMAKVQFKKKSYVEYQFKSIKERGF